MPQHIVKLLFSTPWGYHSLQFSVNDVLKAQKKMEIIEREKENGKEM